MILTATMMVAAALQTWSPCPDYYDSVEAVRWPHPTEAVVAVLCRDDPWPGWSESLWVLDGERVTKLPLHGSGVDSFAWLDCDDLVLAHIVDSTHMGTVTDRIMSFQEDGTIRAVDEMRIHPDRGTARTNPPCPGYR